MQNMILANSAVATMTSLEMVDFINSQRGDGEPELTHANFLAKVPKVLGETSNSFECDVADSYGRPRKAYCFPKREACLMAMSYSYDLQAKVFDRMTALEHKPQHLIPQTLSEALRLAADLSDQRNAAVAQLAIVIPKAEALDRISTADGSLCLTDAAKELQCRPKDFISWLSCNQWIYKRAGSSNWIGYQGRIQSGFLEHKANIIIDAAGNERVRDQVRVTGKGLARLARIMQAEAA